MASELLEMTRLRASQKTRRAQATDRRQRTLCLAATSGLRLGGTRNQRDVLRLQLMAARLMVN